MKTILLVEDDWGLASHWQALLEEAGHRVIHEHSVKGSIDVFDSSQVDLVVTDIMIESSDGRTADEGGLELISYISLHVNPLPRIIAISGAVGQSSFVDRNFDRLSAMRALRKPVSDSELLSTVEASFRAEADDRLNELIQAARQIEDDIDLVKASEVSSVLNSPERDNAIQLLKAAQFRLQQTQFSLDHAPDGVYWVDRDGRFIYTNHWNCRLLGYSRQELLSKTVMDIAPHIQNRDIFQQKVLPRISESGYKVDAQHRRKDGTLVPVEVTARVLEYEGELIVCAYVRDISERKKREEELVAAKLAAEEGERRFRSLANSVTPLCWTMEPDSNCNWLNTRWLDYCGKPLKSQLGNGWLKTVHRDDREHTKEVYLAAFEKQADFKLDYRLRRHDGTFRWHTADAVARFDSNGQFIGYVGMSFDNHDDRLHMEQLQESRQAEQEANASVQAMMKLLGTSDGVWTWKIGTEQIDFAPGFRTLLGLAADDLESFPNSRVSLIARIHPDDRAGLWAEIRSSIEQKSTFVYEFRILDGSSKYIWVRSRGTASYKQDGSANLMVGSTYDISDAKEAQLKLEQESIALARSNADLAQFAYAASHDLKEPLRAVSGFLQLLQKTHGNQLDEAGQEYISKSVAGAARMGELINDLLLYSQIGQAEIAFGPVDLNQVVSAAVKEQEEKLLETGAKVEYQELATVWAATPLMMQLFRNLIGNAIKYRSKSEPRIQISSVLKGNSCTIRVKDNGIGIASQYQEQVFELFRRLHHREEHSGTGIGLAICKKAVERLGGTISVESNEGSGCCFVIVIPIDEIP